MSKIKNENFIHIGGWMINDLHLKGNELLVYACIYGFSQTEQQCFAGSLQYLADWASCTKQGIIKNLKSLLEKGLIEKKEYERNKIKFCEYKVTEFNSIQHSLIPAVKQSLPNNIEEKNIDKENNKKKKKFIKPTYDEVKAFAVEKGREDLLDEFYLYYTELNWCDKYGNEIIVWKSKFNTWCQRKPKETTDNQLPTCTAHQVNGVWKI